MRTGIFFIDRCPKKIHKIERQTSQTLFLSVADQRESLNAGRSRHSFSADIPLKLLATISELQAVATYMVIFQ